MNNNSLTNFVILEQPIINLLSISVKNRDYLTNHLDCLRFASLRLPSVEWERVRGLCVYPEDALDNFLSFSLSYIYRIWPREDLFKHVLETWLNTISDLLGETIFFDFNTDQNYNPFNQSKEFYILKGLSINNSFFLPKELYKKIPSKILISKLHSYGISDWEIVFGLTETEVLEKYDLNITVEILYSLWELYPYAQVLSSYLKQQFSRISDCDSLETILKSWVARRIAYSVNKERDVDIFMHRVGLLGNKSDTLESLAKKHALTREGIRQLVNNLLSKLHHQAASKELNFLWIIIDSFVQENGGILFISDIAKKLKAFFDWKEPPTSFALINLISNFSQDRLFFIDALNKKLGVITSISFICNQCPDVINFICNLINSDKESNFDEFSDRIYKYCRDNCWQTEKMNYPKTKALPLYLLESNKDLKKICRVKDNRIFTADSWNIKYGRLAQAAESVLKLERKPIHFTRVYEEIKRLRPSQDNISDRNVHASLDRSPNAILWDNGTFIHIENIELPFSLMSEIEEWLLEKLRSGIPFISSYGAFLLFNQRCLDSGIPNELALYSCLKISSNMLLAFPHCPYVFLNEGDIEMPPLPLVLEDFVREAGGKVSKADLKSFAVENLYLKDFMLAQLLDRTPNIVKSGSDDYLHIDLLNISKEKILGLVDYAVGLLSKEEHVSIVRIFNDKKVTCKLMGMDSPELLFSIIKFYAADKIQTGRFPQIRLLEHNTDTKKGISNEIVEYIKDKKKYCTYQELEKHFVDNLGYSEQTVYFVAYQDSVYRYSKGCFIHHDTIGWTEEKQTKIEEIASSVYDDAILTEKPFGSISNMVETDNYDQLPKLDNNIYWTDTLVASLLEKSEHFKIIGNKKNAFVKLPNKLGINSLEDLVYSILKTKYGGAYNFNLFEKMLVDAGIIQKSLTSSMINNSKKITIMNNEIYLSELVSNA